MLGRLADDPMDVGVEFRLLGGGFIPGADLMASVSASARTVAAAARSRLISYF